MEKKIKKGSRIGSRSSLRFKEDGHRHITETLTFERRGLNEDRKAGEGVGCTGIGEGQCRWKEVREEESSRRGTQVKAGEEG